MVRCGLLGVLPRIPRISARAQPSLTSHSASSVASRKKSVFSTIVRRSASHAVLDALRPLCGAPRHTAVL
ncbi:hypothetical protein KPSA3_04824 [Pseudomonas syringae pv. actinidiae]|uniref:Uncharacterized protein n=1 Tax=Pseudomonas syringae pv. actinidiae TaxID=103796 RepID=A0AAN4Q895_PSESF|nr:hypothetical protein KPSA3_04824 [Pseudomonas syringae pv. actinidiae]